MVAIKSFLDKAVEAVADIPEREILSVSVSLDGPRVHLEWPFFQKWFGGRQVHLSVGHVSIVHEGVTYTAIMERSVLRGSIICPMAGVEVEA